MALRFVQHTSTGSMSVNFTHMLDFGRWLANQKPAMIDGKPAEEDLPDNVRVLADTEYQAKCCICHEWGELYCDIKEIPLDGSYEHYCGGSPRCGP